jgi:AraC family ethanolamine operon transcriptional activator
MDTTGVPVVVTEVTGIESLRGIIRGADFSATQLSPGSFRGQLHHAEVDGMPLSSGTFSANVRLRSLTTSNKVMLATILRSTGSVIHWNHDVIAGDVCVCPRDHEQEGYFRGETAYASILLSHEEIAEAAVGFERVGDLDWSRIARYRASPQMRESLCRKINASVEIVRTLGSDLSARAQTMMRGEIADAFFTAAAETFLAEARQPHIANSARTVKLVEDYVAARSRVPPPLGEICRDLNLSRRTLHRAFQETLGVGPKAYLRLSSLSTARRALIEATPGTTSVTEIALDNGFFELGRFSVLYRQMFGESPSDTLRR